MKWRRLVVVGCVALAILCLAPPSTYAVGRCVLKGKDPSATSLDFSNCELTNSDVGAWDFTPFATTLRRLDLGGNALSTLPASVASLRSLELLFAGDNHFTYIPVHVKRLPRLAFLGLRGCRIADATFGPSAHLPSLTALVLTDNRLTLPPTDILRVAPRIRKLMLSHNNISTAASLAGLGDLELLRLAANPSLSDIPPLATLPALKWFAAAGTALAVAPTPLEPPLEVISMSEVTLGGALGHGASSTVSEGVWRQTPVAVKAFRKVSSDGRAVDEVAVWSSLRHPAIVSALAVVDSPMGLLLELLPHPGRLGAPPTFAKVVRDTYPVPLEHGLVTAAVVAIAEALAYVHSRGVVHGDVYAHNILWSRNDTGGFVVKLSDFGASWAPPPSLLRECTVAEGRAYAVLIDELLAETKPHPHPQAVEIAAIARDCASGEVTMKGAVDRLLALLHSHQ